MYFVKMPTRIYFYSNKYQAPRGAENTPRGPRRFVGLLTLAETKEETYNRNMRTWIWALCLLVGSPLFAQNLPVQKILNGAVKPPRSVRRVVLPQDNLSKLRYVPPRMQLHTPPVRGAAQPQQEHWQRLQRAVTQKLAGLLAPSRATSLAETEKRIRQSLVEVVGRASGELMGSGFVVRAASGRLYAVVSYHVVGRSGNQVAVRLHDASGKAIRYEVEVSAAGSFGINALDAAIIALPEAAAAHVQPLTVAQQPAAAGSELVLWGRPYVMDRFARVEELKVTLVQPLKIVMESEEISDNFNGFCGSPLLNDRGEVMGIYSGHNPDTGHAFAVNAQKALQSLIALYEQGTPMQMSFKLYGQPVLTVGPEETVGWVRQFNSNGQLVQEVYLPRFEGEFDPEHAERLFEKVNAGDFLEFEVVKHRFVDRTVSINVS